MRLFVLRHAIAEEPRAGKPDSARQLTEPGRAKARRMLAHARSVGVRPASILSSPYRRAAQTAEIACAELQHPHPAIETRSLLPYVSLFDLWEEIRAQAAAGDVMVVGHNPQLSSLTAALLGARSDALWLKKSGLVALDLGAAGSNPRASLLWLLTPGSVGR